MDARDDIVVVVIAVVVVKVGDRPGKPASTRENRWPEAAPSDPRFRRSARTPDHA